ncbi:MAG: hypothetical protein Q8R60_19835 [Mycobacteriales bacterium]|nr:hypothetical protein [Mycobacteriales bacterium]
MRKKAGTLVLATSLGLGGLATGVVLAPAMATAATSETSTATAVGDRVTRIKDALKGLVTDKTLTQAQADKVATTLAESLPPGGPGGRGRGHGPDGRGHGPGGRGFGAGLDAAATAIGITEAELKAQLAAGKALAQVAEANDVSKADLIAALVKAAEAKLAQAVTDGKITQAQADERKATLTARITESVDKVRPARGHHMQEAPAETPATTSSSTA